MSPYRSALSLVIAACTAACGGSENGAGGGTVSVVPSPTPAPIPSPGPAPTATAGPDTTATEDGPTPPPSNAPGEVDDPPSNTPSPAPSPSPTPQAAVPVDLIVRGSLNWTFVGAIPDDKRAAITNAMNAAVNVANTVAAYTATIRVMYNSGVPTAQASYNNNITFGGSISYRVALHEMSHWLGVGSYNRWGSFVVGGRYTGAQGLAQMRAYLGPDATIGADRQHFWPYGWNFDREAGSPQRNVAMVTAFRRDMGLSDGMSRERLAGTFRLANRSSGLLLAAPAGAASGAVPILAASTSDTAQQWAMEPADGFVTLRNLATGLYLDGTGATVDRAETGLRAVATDPAQQWEMLPMTDGWFLLRNRATNRCIDNIAVQTAGAHLAVWSCGGSANQQWHLAR